jgi:hypothetical protein
MVDKLSLLPACPQCAHWPMALRTRRKWFLKAVAFKCGNCGFERVLKRSVTLFSSDHGDQPTGSQNGAGGKLPNDGGDSNAIHRPG